MIGYDKVVLGMLLHDRFQLEEAETLLRESVAIFDSALGENHQYTASALTELGAVLNSQQRSSEALPLLERAMQIRMKDYEPEYELVAASRVELADSLTRLGRLEEAETHAPAKLRGAQRPPRPQTTTRPTRARKARNRTRTGRSVNHATATRRSPA